jgi:hypothetical protein
MPSSRVLERSVSASGPSVGPAVLESAIQHEYGHRQYRTASRAGGVSNVGVRFAFPRGLRHCESHLRLWNSVRGPRTAKEA